MHCWNFKSAARRFTTSHDNQSHTIARTHEEVPAELIAFIRRGDFFIVAGHKEPDGDCVGSQLAIASALRRLGKTVTVCSAGPFKRPEVKAYEHLFSPMPETTGTRVLVMDCAAPDRVGDLQLEGLPLFCIDHHDTSGSWGNFTYLDRKAPSVTFMAAKIITALGLEITKEEAELLLFGLCTDTGFFRHVDSEGAEVFAAAARLTKAGANPKTVFAAMNGNKTLASRLLMGRILSRTKAYHNGRLLVSYEALDDTREFGEESRDSDMLYQLLQSVAGVEAIALIRQESVEKCTLGLRSRDRVNVALIAKQFGGGGHYNAAGALVPGTIADLVEPLVDAFAPQMT
ncbi:MAG: bifunctional oligoribonuclease/PAP phosphatase NrnA [Treponema sp.]|nr:bifunctional oligoribonuclease/PAP phosphatase NrnA [Treponema sp.]